MSALRIAKNLTLPPEAVTETVAILGVRGSGKSTTATVYAEELLAQRQQIVVIDPTDVWWGLKSSADGTEPGYPVVILGGKKGDLPLEAEAGATVADFVLDTGASVICSLRRLPSKAAQRRFVTDFAERLYARVGLIDEPRPLAVFIDEASLFVPQRVGADEARMVGAIQQLVRQGRTSGFGVTLIDQRAASVNKDVLTQLEVLVAHRTTSPQDRKALQEWIRENADENQAPIFLQSLAALPRGRAWFWSPGFLDVFKQVDVRAARTFDSRRTPKPGERVAGPTRVADVDLDALKTKLAASIERAKADDPKALRTRIAELEREARVRGDVLPNPVALDEAYTRGRDDVLRTIGRDVADDLVTMQGVLDELAATADVVGALRERGNVAYARLRERLTATLQNDAPLPLTVTATYTPLASAPSPALRPVKPPTPRAEGAAKIGRTGQAVLDALAFFESIGEQEVSHALIAGMAGVSHTTGSWAARLSELRVAGLIVDPRRGVLALSDAGRDAADASGAPRTLADVHARFLAKLGGTSRRMLEHLLAAYPAAVTKADLARAVGVEHTTGSFAARLSEVRAPGMLEDVDRSSVRAHPRLFPRGLR